MCPTPKTKMSVKGLAASDSSSSDSEVTKRSVTTEKKSIDNDGADIKTTMQQTAEVAPDQILIEDKFYDANRLSDFHPGGPLFLKAFAGRDATQAFLSYHRKRFPHKRVEKYLAFHDPSIKFDDNEDFLELCERVEKVIPRHASFAPWSYYIKASFIMAMSVYLEIRMHLLGEYPWYEAALLGFFYALIGLNIQHDANHGSLSRRPWINRLWGLGNNWYGHSAISWIHQHVVQHHVHTNDVHLDPDIEGKSPILRLNPYQPLVQTYVYQHIYYFLLILAFGYNIIYQAVLTIVTYTNKSVFSALLKPYILQEHLWNIFFISRWFVLPFFASGFDLWCYVRIFPMFAVFGSYLSFFFHISHNFQGVMQLEDTSNKHSFLYNQLITSSNVCGWKLCMLNGGLNYQIEHHLFPRMHHSHYPRVSPIVKQFCQEKGYPYHHFYTILENVRSCIVHLEEYGTKEIPQAAKRLNLKEIKKAIGS